MWRHRELEKMASQVIVPEVCCLESAFCGHHIYKRVWTPVVGEVFSGIYPELAYWLQVSMKTHDDRLTFATLTLAMFSRTEVCCLESAF